MHKVYLDNKFINEKEAKLSCMDPGFIYGQGCFETMRAYQGRVFLLKEHLDRITASAKFLRISPGSPVELESKINRTLSINNLKNAFVRLIIWKGIRRDHIFIMAGRLNLYPERFYRIGFKVIISSLTENETSKLSGIKSLNYLTFRLSRIEAKERGADEALLKNTKGYISEGASSSIFIAKNNVLLTPPLESGILPGITRKFVIELAKKNSIMVREKMIRHDELFKADEIFLASSLKEIMPVTNLEGKAINSGRIGNLSSYLLGKYREQTRR